MLVIVTRLLNCPEEYGWRHWDLDRATHAPSILSLVQRMGLPWSIYGIFAKSMSCPRHGRCAARGRSAHDLSTEGIPRQTKCGAKRHFFEGQPPILGSQCEHPDVQHRVEKRAPRDKSPPFWARILYRGSIVQKSNVPGHSEFGQHLVSTTDYCSRYELLHQVLHLTSPFKVFSYLRPLACDP